MQIGFDVGATKIESVVLKDNGEEINRNRIDCPKDYNLIVNSVVPGWTITERQIEKWLTPESEADMIKKQCIKKRLKPSDIAKAVLFFSSDQSSGCTNQSYVVDNGWL